MRDYVRFFSKDSRVNYTTNYNKKSHWTLFWDVPYLIISCPGQRSESRGGQRTRSETSLTESVYSSLSSPIYSAINTER